MEDVAVLPAPVVRRPIWEFTFPEPAAGIAVGAALVVILTAQTL